jgi:hypothetical protein
MEVINIQAQDSVSESVTAANFERNISNLFKFYEMS